MIDVLCCGGIGESGLQDTDHGVTGMLANITRGLDTKQFAPQWVPWIDEYGPVPKWNGVSYDETQRIGASELGNRIAASTNPVLLLGYSAGADLVGTVGSNHDHVIGVATVADPRRQRLFNLPGYGIVGERPVRGCWSWSVANPNDYITSCPAGSPLRTIADITQGFSVTDPLAWGNALRQQVFQQWWKSPQLDWGSVASGLAGYLSPYPWGQHTGYDHMTMPGTSETYTSWLTDQLNTWRRWDDQPAI